MPTTPSCSSSPRPPQLQPSRSRRAPMRTSSNPGQTRLSPGGATRTMAARSRPTCNGHRRLSRTRTIAPSSTRTSTRRDSVRSILRASSPVRATATAGGRSPPTARPGSSSKSVSPPRAPPTAARAPRITSPPPSPLRDADDLAAPAPDAHPHRREAVRPSDRRGRTRLAGQAIARVHGQVLAGLPDAVHLRRPVLARPQRLLRQRHRLPGGELRRLGRLDRPLNAALGQRPVLLPLRPSAGLHDPHSTRNLVALGIFATRPVTDPSPAPGARS